MMFEEVHTFHRLHRLRNMSYFAAFSVGVQLNLCKKSKKWQGRCWGGGAAAPPHDV